MQNFILWYLLITALGWLTFPLAYRLFPNFADRGFTLSRALGLLLWGYIFWMTASLGAMQNDVGGILLAFFSVVAISVGFGMYCQSSTEDRASSIAAFIKENISIILITEILFLLAFAFLATMRAANPEILGTEKPMELAFINAIMRSPTFPPRDPWLSGYAISYYYFGYVMTAMIAKVTSTPGTVAFNLMTPLVFALAAIGSYGILYNLLSNRKSAIANHQSSIVNRQSFLAPLFLLIVSNIEGLLHVIYTRGLLSANFWKWLNLKDLTEPPASSSIWIPDQFWWWWRASRVVQDFDLKGGFQEVIDEFPFFSFLLGDLHPHVLAIPFGLLVIAVALHVYLDASRGPIQLPVIKLHLSPLDLFLASLVLGGIAFLNTWDILTAAALMVSAYVLSRVQVNGWSWSRIEDALVFGVPLVFLAFILYLPFYLGFSSQAGGLLPNLITPTRGAHLWVMFASLLIPIFAYLLYLWRGEKISANWSFSILFTAAIVILLWMFSWALGWAASLKDPVFAVQYLASQGMADANALFRAASERRLSYIGSLLTLVAILIPSIAFLARKDDTADDQPQNMDDSSSTVHHPSSTFILLLIVLASFLVLMPEFVYLRDYFGTRMNTIFKFYYQAWILWSLAASYGIAVLFQELRGFKDILFRVAIGMVLFSSLLYPVLGTLNRTNNFHPSYGFTLDDFDRVARDNPDEAAAIRFLESAPDGVVSEAIGGSYTGYARISAYTGLPTVLGWPGHESQWRGGGEAQGSREHDIELLYSTSNWQTAQEIIARYNIRYIYVGSLERSSMNVQEEKFRARLSLVFAQGMTAIYEVPIGK